MSLGGVGRCVFGGHLGVKVAHRRMLGCAGQHRVLLQMTAPWSKVDGACSIEQDSERLRTGSSFPRSRLPWSTTDQGGGGSRQGVRPATMKDPTTKDDYVPTSYGLFGGGLGGLEGAKL